MFKIIKKVFCQDCSKELKDPQCLTIDSSPALYAIYFKCDCGFEERFVDYEDELKEKGIISTEWTKEEIEELY